MHVNGVVLELWLHGKLESATEVLSRDIALNGKSHHAFANRALVQARLQKWDEALLDADMVINYAFLSRVTLKSIHPSRLIYSRRSSDVSRRVLHSVVRADMRIPCRHLILVSVAAIQNN